MLSSAYNSLPLARTAKEQRHRDQKTVVRQPPVRRSTKLENTGIPGTALIHSIAPPPAPQPVTSGDAPVGTRRLRDIPRHIQRPLESRLYHLRRVWNWTDAEISRELDVHPADLDALASTHGQP